MTTIAVIANSPYGLHPFRSKLLRLLAKRANVVCYFPLLGKDAAFYRDLFGCPTLDIRDWSLQQTGMNPLRDFISLVELTRALRMLRPDAMLVTGIKAAAYACIAGRLAPVPRRYALITGLGFSFSGAGLKARLARTVVTALARLGMRSCQHVFFQNRDDQQLFHQLRIAHPEYSSVLPGSGVDLTEFTAQSLPIGPLRFLFAARLLREKGVLDFVEAARILRPSFPQVRFQVLGPIYEHPSGLSRAQIDDLAKEGVIEYLGSTTDIRPFLKEASVVVLPSYYREGVPHVLLEAIATGRAVITTDTPGCRDTIDGGKNGVLIPPRNPIALAEAMRSLIQNPHRTEEMGKMSLDLARSKFDLDLVNSAILARVLATS